MNTPNRRDLLSSLPLGAAVLSAPAFADDHGHLLRERVARLRARWRADDERFAAHLDGHGVAPGPLATDLATLRGGIVAYAVFKETERLPIEEQVHPSVQRLIRQLAGAVGAAVRVAGEAAGGWADGWGAEADPEGIHLRAALRRLRTDLAQASLAPTEAAWVEGLLANLLDEPVPGWLRQRARVGARQARKADRLSVQIADDPSRTGLLESEDPIVLARVEAALAARAALPPEEAPATEAGEGEASEALAEGEVLGLIVLGLVFVGGLFLSVVGICAVMCGAVEIGGGLLLLGIGVMAVAVGAMRRITGGAGLRSAGGGDTPAEVLRLSTSRHALLLFRGLVAANPEWMPTYVRVKERHHYTLHAWGLLLGGSGLGAADPDGDGSAAGPEALLPGAPRLGLIGRVGDAVFFVGSSASVPDGLHGDLYLAVNSEPDQYGLRGAYQVVVAREWVAD